MQYALELEFSVVSSFRVIHRRGGRRGGLLAVRARVGVQCCFKVIVLFIVVGGGGVYLQYAFSQNSHLKSSPPALP